MWRNIKFDMCNLYYTCLHVCVCVCLCVCVIHWRYLIHERDIVHVFVCRNRKKTTRVKIYNAIKLNFYLGLLRIHKEFPILSVRSMLCLENLVHCLFLKKCLIEVKMGFICGFFLKWEIFCCHFLFVIVLLIVFFILNVLEKYFYYENSEDGFWNCFLNFLCIQDFVPNWF